MWPDLCHEIRNWCPWNDEHHHVEDKWVDRESDSRSTCWSPLKRRWLLSSSECWYSEHCDWPANIWRLLLNFLIWDFVRDDRNQLSIPAYCADVASMTGDAAEDATDVADATAEATTEATSDNELSADSLAELPENGRGRRWGGKTWWMMRWTMERIEVSKKFHQTSK